MIFLFVPLLLAVGSRKVASHEQNNTHTKNNNQEAEKMPTEKTIELIKQKNKTVVSQKVKVSPEVAQSIVQLMQHEDYKVRRIALQVLNNNPGEATRVAVIQGLRDENINVRSLAGRMLLTHYNKQELPVLTKELSANNDEFVREHIALALGKIEDQSAINALKIQNAKETNPEAKHAMHLALTRLKDPESQKHYIQRLQQADPKELAIAIQDFDYIRDPVFLKEMLPLLDDTRAALDVGWSDFPKYIRVCDVVINTMDAALEHPFTFEALESKEYSPDEINQAKDTLRRKIGNVSYDSGIQVKAPVTRRPPHITVCEVFLTLSP